MSYLCDALEDYAIEHEDRRIDYLPTSSEISQACARIRSEWTLSEKRRRFVGDLAPEDIAQDWCPPVIDTSHFRLALSGAKDGV